MGLSTSDVPYLTLAEQWGAGKMALSDPVALNRPQDGEGGAFHPTGVVRQLTRSVRADSACSACYAALVRALYLTRNEGTPPEIAIGQGWRGKSFPGTGIGNCCAGADLCVRGCPPAARDIAAFLRRSR